MGQLLTLHQLRVCHTSYLLQVSPSVLMFKWENNILSLQKRKWKVLKITGSDYLPFAMLAPHHQELLDHCHLHPPLGSLLQNTISFFIQGIILPYTLHSYLAVNTVATMDFTDLLCSKKPSIALNLEPSEYVLTDLCMVYYNCTL